LALINIGEVGFCEVFNSRKTLINEMNKVIDKAKSENKIRFYEMRNNKE